MAERQVSTPEDSAALGFGGPDVRPSGDIGAAVPGQGRTWAILLTVLGVAYTVLAIAALARSGYQALSGYRTLSGTADLGRTAVVLSGVAGAVYLMAAVGLRRATPRGLLISRWCCAVELFGVIAVSLVEIWSGGFGRTAVWSGFGVGYGYVPLLLPVLGLWVTRPAALRSVRTTAAEE